MSFKSFVARTALKLSKESPKIMVIGGVIFVAAGTVIACKKTLTVDEITEPAKKKLADIHKTYEKQSVEDENGNSVPLEVPYEESAYRKDLATVYIQTGAKLVKHYAPAIALGGLGIGGIFYSHGLLSKRNAALGSAYMGLSEAYKNYRDRVKEELGNEKDYHFATGAKETIEKVQVVDEETGKKKSVEKVTKSDISKENSGMPSPYAKFFDETCDGWDEDPYYSLQFLKNQQRFANDLLQARGHVFLNEIYDMLGITRTTAGQIVGWVKDNPNGDNHIDFGLYDEKSDAGRRFVNGDEKVVLLDFNVDGPIYELI